MSKVYSFNVGQWDFYKFFSPIRSQIDCIRLLMETIKVININQEIDESKSFSKILLSVSKMKRAFYISTDKIFSINFPFSIREINNKPLISSSIAGFEIDSQVTSLVLSIINDTKSFESDCIYEFLSTFEDNNTEDIYMPPLFWSFFRDLMLFESGYIRYDHDEERANFRLHPVDHYDIFYSSNSTFKIGLKERASYSVMYDLLDLGSECHFIDKVYEDQKESRKKRRK